MRIFLALLAVLCLSCTPAQLKQDRSLASVICIDGVPVATAFNPTAGVVANLVCDTEQAILQLLTPSADGGVAPVTLSQRPTYLQTGMLVWVKGRPYQVTAIRNQ